MDRTFDVRRGESVHRALLAAGGFCWDHRPASETISIHFNKGKDWTPELKRLVFDLRNELKAFVFWHNDELDRMWARSRG